MQPMMSSQVKNLGVQVPSEVTTGAFLLTRWVWCRRHLSSSISSKL